MTKAEVFAELLAAWAVDQVVLNTEWGCADEPIDTDEWQRRYDEAAP